MTPKRGVGEKSFNKIIEVSKNKRISLFQASKLLAGTDEVNKKASSSLDEFIKVIERVISMIETTQYPEILKVLLDESGYMDMLKNDKNVSAQTKIENINHGFVNIILTQMIEH